MMTGTCDAILGGCPSSSNFNNFDSKSDCEEACEYLGNLEYESSFQSFKIIFLFVHADVSLSKDWCITFTKSLSLNCRFIVGVLSGKKCLKIC